MPGTGSWQLRDCERIIVANPSLLRQNHILIGITRVRNEALVLRDTLDHVGNAHRQLRSGRRWELQQRGEPP